LSRFHAWGELRPEGRVVRLTKVYGAGQFMDLVDKVHIPARVRISLQEADVLA